MMKILYFGRLSDAAGQREQSLELPDQVTTLFQLKAWLSAHNDMGEALDDASIKTMINQQLVLTDFTLKGDEEVGFLPPVGGG